MYMEFKLTYVPSIINKLSIKKYILWFAQKLIYITFKINNVNYIKLILLTCKLQCSTLNININFEKLMNNISNHKILLRNVYSNMYNN